MTTTLDILIAARSKLARPEQWWNGRAGPTTGFHTVCLMGAVSLTCHDKGDAFYEPALLALRSVIGPIPGLLSEWNDAPGRRHSEILAAFDAAIAAERRKTNPRLREIIHAALTTKAAVEWATLKT